MNTNRAYKHWAQIFNNNSTLTSATLDRVPAPRRYGCHRRQELPHERRDRPGTPKAIHMTLPRDYPVLTDYAVSNEAAAYIADALMQLALEFETTHLAQIRRHREALKPEPDDLQLDLFHKPTPL
jgi:hypothetical protein